MVALLSLVLIVSACSESTKTVESFGSENTDTADLARIRAHRNQVKGEINEPIDVRLRGIIAGLANAGEETWLLLRIQEFQVLGPSNASVEVPAGTELSVTLRRDPGQDDLRENQSVEITARLMKSKEGPVLAGRSYFLP